MTNAYFYSNTAVQTSLSGSISGVALAINVAATTGFPVSYPYVLAVDYGAATEELVLVTSAAGLTLTVTRGFGGTSAQGHSIGAVVRHVYNAIDATDYRTHEQASTGVHGVTGAVVGTTDSQTLTNKSLTSPAITGTVTGSASYTTPTITSPTITGTVAGGASYTSPTITGTVAGGASYTAPTITSPTVTGTVAGGASYTAITTTNSTDTNLTVNNSATGTTPFTVNSIAATSAPLVSVQNNSSNRFVVAADGQVSMTPANTATVAELINASSGFVGALVRAQVNSVTQFSVGETGNTTYLGTLTGGTSGQFTVSNAGAVVGVSYQATSMASNSFENTTTFTTSSTSYSAMSGSTTIVVPPSGKVLINASCRMFGNQNNGEMWAAVVVTGSTSGTIRAAADATAMYVRQSNAGNNAWFTSAQSIVITSANVGETLTIVIHGRAGSTASLTVSSEYRGVTVTPLLG